MIKKTIFFLIAIISISTYSQVSTANYTITFTSNWSNTTHPSANFPSNAHWSDLVGATHNENIIFLEMGQIASLGIENVAELGNNNVFFSEINNAISNGFANLLIEGDGLSTPLGTIVINNIITTEEFSLLTLASMIAPSPDWMIAVNSISLIDENGDWIDEITIELYPYDAGTDSGTDYNSSNNDTNPQEFISSLQGIAPFSSEIIGTLVISLEEIILGTDDFISPKDNISIYPNPTTNIITVSLMNYEIKSIEIYNVLGEKVGFTSFNGTSETNLDLSIYPSGIYLLKINDSFNKSTFKKIIKR